MKILFLSFQYYWWDRPGIGALHQAMGPLGLKARGHDVKYLCQKLSSQTFDDDGVPTFSFQLPRWLENSEIYRADGGIIRRAVSPLLVRMAFLAYFARLLHLALRETQDWKPDVIYVQTESAAPVGWLLSKIRGMPFVIHLLGGSHKMRDVERLWWRVKSYPDVVLAFKVNPDAYLIVDDGTRYDQIAEFLGVSKEKIHFWPLPVERPTPTDFSFREHFRIPTGAPLLLAVGRMAPVKRMDLCLSVAIQVLQRISDAHAVLVGDGPVLPELRAGLASAPPSVAQRIHLPGNMTRSQLSSAYRECSAFLTMQEMSISGTNLRDAMINGAPIVGVRRQDDSEVGNILKNETNSLLIPEERLSDVGPAVERLMLDPARQGELRAAARETAGASFEDWETRIAREERLLQSVVDSRRSASRS